MRREEQVGVIAVDDGCGVEADVCDRCADGVEGDEGGDAPDDIARDGVCDLAERKSL